MVLFCLLCFHCQSYLSTPASFYYIFFFSVSLCHKCPLYVEDCLACGSQFLYVLFSCQNFIISAQTEHLVS